MHMLPIQDKKKKRSREDDFNTKVKRKVSSLFLDEAEVASDDDEEEEDMYEEEEEILGEDELEAIERVNLRHEEARKRMKQDSKTLAQEYENKYRSTLPCLALHYLVHNNCQPLIWPLPLSHLMLLAISDSFHSTDRYHSRMESSLLRAADGSVGVYNQKSVSQQSLLPSVRDPAIYSVSNHISHVI